MFTDGPVTPIRIEVLIDLLRGIGNRKVDRTTLYELLQPEGLPEPLDPKKVQAKDTVSAALELGIIQEEEKQIKLTFSRSDPCSSRQILLEALDKMVLASTEKEPYFASFYSYLLSLGKDGAKKQSGDDWAIAFEQHVYGDQRPTNPFNATKLTGLNRWYGYVGLGWYDTNDVFQPNPYERLLRCLPALFNSETKLSSELFMEKLARCCPELDGGTIFIQVNPDYSSTNKVCSLGLSHALIELHLDGIIRLYCLHDSRGWSIEAAKPPYDGKIVQSGRIDSIEYLS